MRRLMYIATFFLMLSLPVWAQHHGGGGGHVSSGGFAGHSSGSFHNGGSFHSGGVGHGSGVHVRTGSSNLRVRTFGRRYPYGYYPYLGYYGWYSNPLDYQDDGPTQDSYNSNDSYTQAPYREDDGLQRDVQALNGKVDRLQQDVDARSHTKLDSEPETALVFRDQHVEEVRNYAISGGAVWVFNDRSSKKIPLTQLDLEATVKKNDERGLDFQVPGPTLSIQIMQ